MSASRYGYLLGCDIVAETPKAVLVRVPITGEEPEEIWLPRSQLEDEGDDLKIGQRDVRVAATHWILNENGLEPDE